MTTTQNTESSVLSHHFPALVGISGDALIDAARDRGVLHACMGCGSILCAPEGMTTEAYMAANPWLTMELRAEWAECCGDEHSYLY